MHAVKAEVKNGRLIVDEPTDLPEGTVIYLEPVAGDEETAEERAAIEAAIDEGLADFEAGRFVDEETVRAKLRAYR